MWFNPQCSNCRNAKALLSEQGAHVQELRYLEERPDRAALERLMAMLGIDDPRQMMRTGEQAYRDLALADADLDELLDAMVANPILIQRPIAIRGDRAVIARPPERALELLE
ncbi:MAG TPA: arsenate reductase (glutaredoxin) [Egibacteraceae bacterium]|nr:arsenate reductase (glutaredoxin) [Egibacteraceae bacterium]